MSSINDIKFALRLFSKNPASTVLSLLVLTIGIGISITIFSLVNGILWGSVDQEMLNRMVRIAWQYPSGNSNLRNRNISAEDLRIFRKEVDSFASLAGFSFHYERSLSVPDGQELTGDYRGLKVTHSFFDVLGVKPRYGRAFTEDDIQTESARAMVISHRVWQQMFSGSSSTIGKQILLSGRPYNVVGIMQEGFSFPQNQDFWFADLFPWQSDRPRSSVWKLFTIGVLKEGETYTSAKTALEAVASRLEQTFPESNTDKTQIEITNFTDNFISDNFRNALFALLTCAIIVALVAAANVSNIIIARTAQRTHELAMRNALGAGRAKVIKLVFLDGLLLSIVGAVQGCLLAAWAAEYIWRQFTEARAYPYWWQIQLDGHVILFVIAITLFVAIATSLFPGLRASQSYGYSILKDDSRSSSSLFVGRVSSLLVGLQIALSTLLLVVSVTMIFIHYQYSNRPYPHDPNQILMALIPQNYWAGFRDDQSVFSFLRSLKAEVKMHPSVEEITFAMDDRTTGRGFPVKFKIVGQNYLSDEDLPTTRFTAVTPEHNRLFGIGMLSGRFFTELDNKESEPVAIVNKYFVDTYFPEENPIDKLVQIQRSEFGGAYYAFSDKPTYRIVGIIEETRQSLLPHESKRNNAEFIVPYWQRPFKFIRVFIKTRGNPLELVTPLRKAMHKLKPAIAPQGDIETLQERIMRSSGIMIILMSLFSFLGLVSLFKAFVGLYAIMLFKARQQRRENGIRIAMGASARHLIINAAKTSGIQIGLGLIVGLTLGYFAAASIKGILNFGSMSLGFAPYLIVALVVILVSASAILVPICMAARVPPMAALRDE